MTSAPGLSQAEAATRLATMGANVVASGPRVRLIARIGNQLRDPLLIVLIGGAALTMVIGHLTDAIVIIALIVVNVTVGVVQEIRADRAITALHHLSAPRAESSGTPPRSRFPPPTSCRVTCWCSPRVI